LLLGLGVFLSACFGNDTEDVSRDSSTSLIADKSTLDSESFASDSVLEESVDADVSVETSIGSTVPEVSGTVFAPGAYMDDLAKSLAVYINKPARDGDTYSSKTAFCYADKILAEVSEAELKEADITEKNVGDEIHKFIGDDIDKFKFLIECMNTSELADFFADFSSQSDKKTLCAINKIGIDSVREGLIEDRKAITSRVEIETQKC